MAADTPAGGLMLLPCYEGGPYDGPLSPFHPLDDCMSNEALLDFLIALSRYGDRDFKSTDPAEIVAHLMQRDSAVLGGGIVAVKGDFRLAPGCCCGLEGWRVWQEIKPGDGAGWLGHDPNAWIDATGPRAVLHTGDTEPFDGPEALEVDYAELAIAAHRAGLDLEGFLAALHRWLVSLEIADATDVCTRIADWFVIGPEALERADP